MDVYLQPRPVGWVTPRLLAVVLFAASFWLAGASTGQEEYVAEPSLQKPLAGRSLLLGGFAVEGLMAVVGERGHILLSRDDGSTWSQAEVPTRAALTAVHFVDAQNGWAVGHDASIVRTRDGGATWELLHFAPEEERPFLDVWFSDADNGVAVGAYGYFLATDDGGDSWFDVEIGSAVEPDEDDYYDYGGDMHLNDIASAANGNLYIAAEAGTAYRSDDGGASWTELSPPYEGSFFGTLPLDGDSLLLFGLRGHMFRSDDGGDSWSELETGSEALLTAGVRTSDGAIVVVGLAGTVLVSTDGGNTFALRQQADRRGLTGVLETANGDLVAFGEAGVKRLAASDWQGGAQ